MNRLLLDTCAFLWWQIDDPRLKASVRGVIERAAEVFVSAASSWEITIKVSLGRLIVPEPVSVALPASGFIELPIRVAHTEQVGALPFHHRDPFDRILVAQARVEGLVLVTRDSVMERYDVTCFWE